MTEPITDILIIDDEADIRSLIQGLLEDDGYHTRSAKNGEEAFDAVQKYTPHLVILDIWLQNSEKDGIEILRELKDKHPFLPIIMISGHGTIETAVSSIKYGAYDFIEKPFKSDRLLLMIRRALEASRLKRENSLLKEMAQQRMDTALSGKSSSIIGVKQLIDKVAATNSRVIITGEPGTGKELAARLIHKQSQRCDQTFMVINCAMMRPEHIESELFGVEKKGEELGSTGLLERSSGGTIFLDEISDMPIRTQSKIVRVVQEQSFCRVGGITPIHVDIRFLASSHRDLEALIDEGIFRKDLYYRLNVVPIHMPNLRERAQDIPDLVQEFINDLTNQSGLPRKVIKTDVLSMMQSFPWPGNVRQLKNAVEWMMIMSGPQVTEIDSQFLPPNLYATQSSICSEQTPASTMTPDLLKLSLREAREEFERQYLLTQMKRFDGNISKTAKFVGMERSALHRKLKLLQQALGEESDPEPASHTIQKAL